MLSYSLLEFFEDQAQRSQRLGVGIYYTGREDFSFGVDVGLVREQEATLEGGDDIANVMAVLLRLRYYF